MILTQSGLQNYRTGTLLLERRHRHSYPLGLCRKHLHMLRSAKHMAAFLLRRDERSRK
jgi:hypothetical protein